MDDKRINSLMNENWSKMTLILDKEMPQKENRRRMFLFWWSIAAVVAIPLIFMALFHTTDNLKNERPSAEYEKEVVASKTVNYENTRSNVHNVTSETKTNNRSVQESKNATNLLVNKSKPKNVILKSNPIKPAEPIFLTKSQMVNAVLDDIPSKNDIKNKGIRDTEIVNNENIQPSENIHSVLALITILPVRTNVLTLEDADIAIPNVKIKKSKPRISFGPEVTALTHDYNKLMATSLGLVGDVSLNRKWNFTTGIRWSRFYSSSPYYSKNDVIVQSNLSKENFDLIEGQLSVNINEKETTVLRQYIINNVTEHLDYAELSLGMAYNINRNVSITSAFLASINIGAKYTQNVVADRVLTNYSAEALSQTNIDDIGLLHNKYMYRLRVGVDLRLYKQLFLVSRADIFTNKKPDLDIAIISSDPMGSIANQNSFKLDNKEQAIGLELGLKYSFGYND
jgi:hypothetical protein